MLVYMINNHKSVCVVTFKAKYRNEFNLILVLKRKTKTLMIVAPTYLTKLKRAVVMALQMKKFLAWRFTITMKIKLKLASL